MANPLGHKIRTARIHKGMRRKTLAELVGKSYAHIANIENQHTSAAPETLVDIAKALGLPISDVMDSDWTDAA